MGADGVASSDLGERTRRRIRVTGTVQGVGFRPFVFREATALGLAGYVLNDSAGVLIEAEGDVAALDELCRILVVDPPPLARVESVDFAEELPQHAGTFEIILSDRAGVPAVPVSVDTATCANCLAELFDPADRRYQYPFTNCTNCGPRYTIVISVPYDREATTMARFSMCDACNAEYHDPASRRFHAEPNACPSCGPQLALLDPSGSVLATAGSALDDAAGVLLKGGILALKGLGGYHLAADATSDAAIGELRRRKARDDKAFAVMVGSLEVARELTFLSVEAEALLASERCPIVLAERRPRGPVVDGVAPGLPELGLMLPYTPLHHLLVSAVGRPLVMTSGNLSDDPIAHRDGDAIARLGPLADAVLSHDRAIHIRCDDSVVRATPRGAQVIRRSRGYAPEPVKLRSPARRPLLAVGAELKSTIAVAKDHTLVLSHHIGDLEHLAAYQSFQQAIGHLCALYGVEPELVAHDLHPEYLSTKWAHDHALEHELGTIGVQHHHAHIASCLVDRAHDGPVLGIAFDGLGFGTDGTLWGGEFLLADATSYERVGHLRTVAMPGGVKAVTEPWRMGLSFVHDAAEDELADVTARIPQQEQLDAAGVLQLLAHGESPVTSSAGRLFDAVAALLGIRSRTTYEGQAAIELEALARRAAPTRPTADYPLARDASGGPIVLDPRPLVRAVLDDIRTGIDRATIAAKFHGSLGRATAEMAADLAETAGMSTVALSGGVFQNVVFTGIVAGQLERRGLAVLTHRDIPPNDGGISAGQALVATSTASA